MQSTVTLLSEFPFQREDKQEKYGIHHVESCDMSRETDKTCCKLCGLSRFLTTQRSGWVSNS